MGAMLCREELAGSLSAGTHGSTFGGNLVSAAAGNVVIRLMRQPGFLEEVRAKGEHFLAGARALQAALPEGRIKAVRGQGLLLGVELDREVAPVIAKLRENGLLVNSAGEVTLRFAPPLIITRNELDEALGILQRVLSTL
jgi:acetylornithine/N-succinyldiaminopimelate aminotransferase